MEKSYETGWEKHGDTWRPPTVSAFDQVDWRELRDAILPPGMVEAYAGASPPTGWLLCQGQAVSRQTYGRLFSVIGTTYGAGDGTTTFNVPNLKGRVVNGLDTAQTEFDTLGETGGSKNITATAIPGHTHGFGHTHGMNSVDTNHAHNVYARNQDTGWQSHDHAHNYDHWHSANIGNMHWNGTQTHGHHGRGSIASEGPWEGANWASAVPVNVTGTGAGGTSGVWTNHYHNFNHDHPSTNYQSESGWAGTWNHAHTTNSQSSSTTDAGTGGGSANGNLPPYLVMHYIIKV